MNNVSEEKKEALTKSLAITGFIAIILFSVWLAVQVVSVIPSAFSSLASIADGIYNYKPTTEMQVTAGKNVVNAGESFTISWTKFSEEGLYTFSYECTEGVAISMRDKNGDIVDVNCEADIELSDKGSTDLTIDSEKQRFIDVKYTVSFTGVEGGAVNAENKITIVNASIPTAIVKEDDTEDEPQTETTPEPEVAGENTTNNNLTAGEPETVRRVIYTIPQSDPNGKIDLAVKLIGVGILTKDDKFLRTGVINTSQTGAFQFEVRNLGTKTSEEWSYEADLPADINYESKDQKPLKPNEYAIITLGFEGLTQSGVESFGIKLDTNKDVNSKNNSFTSAVTVKN